MLSSCPRTKASPPGLAARNAAYRYDTTAMPQAHRLPAPSVRHYENQHWNHPESGMTLPRCTDTVWRLNRGGLRAVGSHLRNAFSNPGVTRRDELALVLWSSPTRDPATR